MTIARVALACWTIPAVLPPVAAVALELTMPATAERVVEDITPVGAYALPAGPWADGTLPVHVTEGRVTRQVWRVEGSGDLDVIRALRAQLEAQGLAVLLDCAARDCGGFDFRFATEVLPPPRMQVDLAAFRFLAAEGPGPEAAGVLFSPGDDALFVQVITVAPEGAPGPAPVAADPAPSGDIGAALERAGRVVLADLLFPSGSAQLGAGDYGSLAALAAWLAADPSRVVALVGHTDAQGSLETNTALSRRRATSVMERLATDYGVPRRQMRAEGVGWLAPVASNLTPEGREANRRVEAVLVGGE
ncbi:MAG: OmpA family protein [Rubellimicrobium sp.]|nr:OmpA family protein [Rubellimicrobium sp.]